MLSWGGGGLVQDSGDNAEKWMGLKCLRAKIGRTCCWVVTAARRGSCQGRL